MEQYNDTGMSCAACSAQVEKAVYAYCSQHHCAICVISSAGNSLSCSSRIVPLLTS